MGGSTPLTAVEIRDSLLAESVERSFHGEEDEHTIDGAEPVGVLYGTMTQCLGDVERWVGKTK